MHELSVAVEVCRLAESRLRVEELPRLRAVGLWLGESSGLEPANLEFCLDALLAAPPFGRGKTEITRTEGRDVALAWLRVDDGDPDD